MTVGTELRQARERAGLTAQQISDRTKIQLYRVAALESGDYERLPQGIYLDGIVRAYARELQLPEGPLIERVRLERGTVPGDLDLDAVDRNEAAPSGHVILDGSGGNDALDWFKSERDLATVTAAPPEPRERQDESRELRPPRRRSRMPLPLLGALAAIVLVVFAYQRQDAPEDRPRVGITTSASPSADQPSASPPPFTENAIAPDPSEDAKSSASPQDIPGIPDTSARPTDSVAAVPSRPESGAAPASVSDLTGAWSIATQVESSSLARFEGLRLGYEMRLRQRGDRVTGVGRKVTENGAGIGRRAQTPVTVNGRIDGDRLLLKFVEKGTRRSTQGTFELLIDESGALRGSFSSTAARSSGRVEAHRLSAQ